MENTYLVPRPRTWSALACSRCLALDFLALRTAVVVGERAADREASVPLAVVPQKTPLYDMGVCLSSLAVAPGYCFVQLLQCMCCPVGNARLEYFDSPFMSACNSPHVRIVGHSACRLASVHSSTVLIGIANQQRLGAYTT